MAFKDFFIKKEEPIVVAPPRPVQAAQVVSIGSNAPVLQVAQGANDYNQHFDEVMKNGGQPKPNFLEFTKAIRGMVGLSEQQAYVAAYSTFAAMGVGVDKLVKSGQDYISLFANEKQTFAATIAQSRKETVTDVTSEVEKQQKEIQDLTAQIQQKNAKVNELVQQRAQAENAIAVEETNFNNTFTNLTVSLQDIIGKIQTYLGNATTTK